MATVSECIEWQGNIHVSGYGRLGQKYAHRVAYEREIGPIPEGLVIDHLCRNRACVNTDHMELVTNGENVMRGEGPAAENARKTRCPKGHPLTPGNLYVGKTRSGGKERRCRTCRLEQQAAYQKRKRGRQLAASLS